jgi:predicted N-acetyltransferase YhbS
MLAPVVWLMKAGAFLEEDHRVSVEAIAHADFGPGSGRYTVHAIRREELLYLRRLHLAQEVRSEGV